MGVYKEGKNWKVQVYYRDWQGNRKRKQKRGFRTKGEAKEWERDFLQQQDNHKKYIQEQESHDIAMNKLSVKEYEGPFKGCDESRALRLERSESQRL